MVKHILLIIIGLLFFKPGFGQDEQKYNQFVEEAVKLYEAKEFLKAGLKYNEAFVALGNTGMLYDRYNAACCWALAKVPDSSFVQLFKVAVKGKYAELSKILNDTDLNVLHNDKRWEEVIAFVKMNEAKLDRKLVAILDTIYRDDQSAYRVHIGEIGEKYGWDSDTVKKMGMMIRFQDSVNLLKIGKILDERGWVSTDVIGQQGSSTIWLVIQHAELAVQEKYLPMMREAVQNGNAASQELALLEDRIALRQGKKQLYGSQIGIDQETGGYYVDALEDPDNVDSRRAEVGLGKLQDYISNWGLTWDVEAYKKKLPEIEAKLKK